MSIVEEFRHLLEAADCSSPPESEALWQRVIAFAIANPGILEQPRVAYAIGLAWYNLSAETVERVANATRCLELAIERDPKDWYAFLYLGHLHFDRGLYAEALEQFLRIPDLAFSENNQGWRDLKRKELCVCCYFRLHQPSALVEAFEEFIVLATHCEELDCYSVHELPQLLATLAQDTQQSG